MGYVTHKRDLLSGPQPYSIELGMRRPASAAPAGNAQSYYLGYAVLRSMIKTSEAMGLPRWCVRHQSHIPRNRVRIFFLSIIIKARRTRQDGRLSVAAELTAGLNCTYHPDITAESR